MSNNTSINFEEYLSELWTNFDESTLIAPNKNGEKEKGIIDKSDFEFKKEMLVEFAKSNSISINEILLASLTLTLNKFNFSNETLIFNQNNVPFATKFENRQISIKEFLEKIHEKFNETLGFDGDVSDADFLLKPEFYYSFNDNLKLDFEYSNYLSIVDDDKTVLLSLFYNNELYTKDFIDLFLSSLEKIIEQIISEDIDKTNICDIALENESEIVFSEIEMPVIHKRFEKQAIDKPDEIALVAEDGILTYKQLNEKANVIANALIDKGVEPKSNVLVMLSRDSNLIASILGILKAGCTFIPIDPEYPQERIMYIYENSQADYIICDESGENSLDIKELLNEGNCENPDVDVGADDLAYMIYTSGSTGNPKGVMISHENMCNQVSNPKSTYNSLLCITTISFDVALDDILTSLSNGLKLILANDVQIKNIPELTKLINENKPEVADFTPSRLASYLEVKEFCKAISCLKCIFIGGEQFSAKVYEDLRKYSDAVVYNSYGPTETTITSNNKEVTDVNDITVGFPSDNYITDVRDIDGKLVPNGVMGELYVGGTGVGKGYYNLEDKTKEVFLTINGIPYYRSGDYAIQLPNGEIDIKGRIDNQIKLRGLRIEIGEIETNIGQYPNIKQVAVVIREINNNDHLCAYYTADGEIDRDDLKEYLKGKLTRYMVPTVFMQLDEMPQTPNGKTDLKQLPEPQLRLSLTLPETETEERIMDIVSEFTETNEFGTTDDLYALGFTSLTLMKLNAMIYEEMGVNLDIIALLNDPTIKNIANEIENKDILDVDSLIELSHDRVYYPLTENQMGIYYECIQSGDVAQYNLPSIIRFGNEIDADKLKRAIIKTIDAYPYLKTRIVTQKGNVVLKRDDSIVIDEIPIVNVDNISDEEIESENLKVFDLHNNQLFRFKIYKTPDETILFSDVHHIISDGESLDKLFINISNAYQGRKIENEAIDGYINSLIESENENSEKYESSKKFFQDKLSQDVDSTILTPNLNGNYEEGILKSISKSIESNLVNKFCSENKITPNVLFMAVTMLNLNKYTFTDKSLITTIFNGRSNSSYINTQALMVRTLPIVSINEDRTLTIKEYLKSVNDIWMETISHSDYPYTKISEEFRLKPEFFYAYNNLDAEEIEIDDKVYKVKYLDSLEVNYKISLDVNETKDNIELFIQYNDQLYSVDYIETFLNGIVNIINHLVENNIEKLCINEIELGENKGIPSFTPVDMPILHKRFEKRVIENPENIALVASDETLTYKQLDEKANIIANALIDAGVKPKSNVLVMLSRDSNLIASILGILKAGCAFIPIDPEYPQERINYIYENSQADYIIANESGENSLGVDDLLREGNCENPNVHVVSDDLAYMIYTSGSTGNPKGVMISHENICNQAQNPKSTYERLLCITTISFDVSVDDILTSLSNGLELILADDTQIKSIPKLIKLIDENKPEVLEITPSRLASYLEVEEFCNAISCLRCVFLGGEQFSAKVFEDLRKYSDAIVYNSYGPTETTITSNNKEVTDVNNLTVGLPLENYITDVRDIDGKLLPLGVMGELYIGGTGVGKGYYNMPEKTNEVFLNINGIPYYRSGDYAIELPNGEIDIKGRIDNQIKLRGLRIEIGEIETNISKYPNIKQAVVVIKKINNNDHLCAYYTAEAEIDSDDLKEFLKERLTRYMVPTVFMQLDEMPKTPNGKTDLKQLPEPQLRLSLTLPETETEERIMDIVSEFTETNEFGTTDDLYALGFTSLTLMKLNAMIYEEMGVNLDIIALLNEPTIKNIAKGIDIDSDEYNIDELIELAEDMDYFSLTENQLGIYYECIQNPGEIRYTMPTVVRFDNDVDANRLKDAIIKTIEAHPYLKTRIVTYDGELKQKKCDDIAIDEIEIVKIDEISDKQIMETDIKPFDLNDNQLFRFKLYDVSDGVVLFVDFHHIIADGVSQINLFNEISNIYENRSIEEEKVNGYVYSLIEENIVNSDRYQSSKQFFEDKFDEDVESTILTPNLNGNPDEGKFRKVVEIIGANDIDEFCNRHSISKNTLFMACTVLALNKFTFTKNTLLTTIFNGRSSSNFYNTQAMLVKTIPFITTNEDREISIIDFIKSVDGAWKNTMNNCFYPYTKIAEEYQLKPEFFYSYHEFLQSEDILINNKSYVPEELASGDSIDFKIDLVVTCLGENIELSVEYNDQLYSEDYIRVFINAMKFILNTFLGSDVSKCRICDVGLEPERQLPEFSEVEMPLIHKRFEKQAKKNPENIALVACDETLTYKQLDEKANIIANALIDAGVKPKSNVLVMLSRDSNLIASILGILKAGCTFIPIDPEYPQERINYIYENSQADYIIANESGENSLGVDDLLREGNCENPNVHVESDDLAYMIYTSGSTGNPKGVMISHENICNQAQNPKSTYERLLCITTISFDVSVDDILTSLSNGLELILADDTQIKSIPKLIKLIDENKPEVLEITPSRLASYLEVEEFCNAISCLRCVFLGGEQFSAKVYEDLRKYSDAIVYNSYGPTETTITSNNKEVTDVNNLTVGLPLENYITDVRDIDGKLVPRGVMGELYIGGTGVGKGYYNMPEKTKEVFLTIDDIPYYRSGDYAIELPNGEIDIKGRIDNQIKLRGLRIEIGEIETNIGQYPNIKQAAVVIKEINGYDHLCAYYTANGEIEEDDLKEFLKDRLTRYMVPTVFMQLDEMPKTPNGKTDLKQLPEPQLKLALVMPETETEEKLFDIVSSLINIEEFGVTDDLYALGFTSLTLMKLNSIIYEQMNGNLDISILFNEPTIKNFAIELDSALEKESDLEEIIESAKGLEFYPLTENQLGVYYECVQSPDVIKYTMPTTVRFAGDVDAERLKDAIIKTVEAHPYLKTRIVTHDGELKQKRCDDVTIDEIEIVKVDNISDEEIAENDVGPISLDDSQLFRFKIYETFNDVVLFSDFHHIITDGVSQNNLFRDIANIYGNNDVEEEIVDGYIYSILEKNLENSERYQSAKEFFDDKLTHEIESTVLTPNLSGNPDEGKIRYIVDNIDSELINEFCNDNSISKNALFMASIVLGLNKFTFSDKTLITTIFNGRSSPNYFNTQGFLVKTIPFIIDNENRSISVRDFIKSVDQTWKNTLKNSIYPYTKIAEKYQLKPEFFYTYHEFLESDDMVVDNKVYEARELSANDLVTTDSKISLAVYDEKEEFSFFMEYNDQLYTEEYVQKFLNAMKSILVQFIENDIDAYKIRDIALVSEKEVPVFGDVEDLIIHERFEKQVDETPDNVALIASDETLTYEQLDQKANRIANALIKLGVKPKSRILIMLPRNSNLVSSIFGVLKAGCAYIPIDLAYPQDRVDYIYDNSQADYIIANETKGNAIGIDYLLKEENIERPNVKTSPEDLIYMIYTSGSTGKPKGVMISHRNVANLYAKVDENTLYKNVSKLNKSLSITSVSFDPFMMDLSVMTLGLAMVLAGDTAVRDIKELTDLIKREKPDLLSTATPSRINQFIEYSGFRDELNNFKEMYLGGEMLPEQFAAKIKSLCDSTIYNAYGPTETTIMCSFKEIVNSEDITVGKASNKYVMDVRDIDGKLVPDGVMGELYVGGPCVGKGYYNLDDKTKEVFMTINDTPYYKTGDYSIKLPNGEFTIEGRIDNQIKLRGLRIEIGEIETNIVRFPHVKQCVVLIKEINNAEHLCAYLTADEKIDINLLKRYLANKLTEYMVPTVFMQLDEMPISPNGKTDIKRLPKPTLNLEYVEAESETEEKLVELVASIADTTEFGTTDDLYTIGFSSLTLMKLNSLIYQEMGVNLDIASLFDDPTIKNLADSIDNYVDDVNVDEIIDLAKDMDYFPVTANQLGIYYECMQNQDEIKYTMPSCIRFNSNIDPNKLKQAIITTIESHPYLKTRIVNTDDGELKQKRCDDYAIDDIEIIESGDISDKELMENDVRPFNLTEDQLFRFKIYKTPEETVLFSDFHHIITDGVSQFNLFEDITKAYNGQDIEAEKIDGFAYSLIEQINCENEVSKQYFHDKLTQGIDSTVLTPDLNGNPDIGEIKLVKDEVNSKFVRHFCKDHAISPNVLFMTTTIMALNKFTFSDKSLITTIFNGRANSDYFNTQGMLVKTIPIIINGEDRQMMIEDFIKLVDKSWKESLVHSRYPYTKLSEEYQLKPEFFYAFHEFFQSEDVVLDNESYTRDDLDGTVATDYKINLNIYDDGEEINLILEYNDQLYSEEYVKKFLEAIKFILVQFFVNDMDKYRICDVRLKDDFGLHEFSEVEIPFIHKRFEKQVRETPDNVALVASDATLTYAELNMKANRVANALINKGIEPNSNVLIMLPRNSNLISTILGVLKAGCAFIPIDIEYPKGRIDYIFENSQADYLIAEEIIENSIDVKELLKEKDTSNPQVDIAPDDLAYMIYTSGSTGNPKGVMTTHKNITNLFSKSEDSVIYNAYSKMKKTLALSTVSFDAFLLDFMPLTFGLEMVLANDSEIKSINELTDLVKREKPDALTFSAPSRFKQYLEYEEFAKQVPNFRYIGVGGEMVPQDLIAQLLEYSNLEIYNIYGPTETTVTCNTHKIASSDNITVGKALHNCITEVRDIDGKLLPSGIMGELYIGGNGVSRGYYNMPEKTKEAFITINSIPYYKSGDYAIELPNGELVIKGRIDNQIKLRGLRIEIGEIESNISKYPNIKQNVVLIKKINNIEHLCAYFTAEEKIDTNDLKEFLTQKLTRYMIPTVFVQLDEMPISPNGKTDIKQLPEPKLDLNYVAPENELEQLICAIFSSTLGIETVGAEDNFFEIGGTSLIASKIILELLKRDYSVKYDDVFSNQTPRQLAKFLSGDYEVKQEDYDIIDEYDYSDINSLLSENTLENFYDGEKRDIGNLLLTGVTGYLGIHVLYDYLKNEGGTVYCMLRKGGFDSLEERLVDLMDYYFDEDLTDLIGSRIILMEGDITELDDFKKFEKCPIDTIINCAAIVKHYTADDYIFKVNVDGVINGLKFAQSNGAQYVQVSTMSVLSYPEDVKSASDVEFDERTFYYGQDLTNKYVNSKFLAERKVLEAAINGLDVKIVRVGNLMGRYKDGLFQRNYDTNAFLANIKSIKNIQAISSSMYCVPEEMSPIDCTAKAIITLSKAPQKCRVFNCQNVNAIVTRDIIEVLNSFGYDIRKVSDDEFIKICRDNMDENIQGLITSDMSMNDEEYEVEDDFEYVLKTDQTVEILQILGFNWPKLDNDYLTRLFTYLNNLGFFN